MNVFLNMINNFTAYLMQSIGFTYCFVVCTAIMGIAILTGFLFIPVKLPDENNNNEDNMAKVYTKYTLKVRGM